MRDLVEKVIKWGEEKGISENSTPEKQFLKTMEKVGELAKAIGKNDLEEIKGAIGEVAVALILQKELRGLDGIIAFPIGNTKFKDLVGFCFDSMENGEEIYFNYAFSCLHDMARKYNFTFLECLQSAYNKISKLDGERGGKIDE